VGIFSTSVRLSARAGPARLMGKPFLSGTEKEIYRCLRCEQEGGANPSSNDLPETDPVSTASLTTEETQTIGQGGGIFQTTTATRQTAQPGLFPGVRIQGSFASSYSRTCSRLYTTCIKAGPVETAKSGVASQPFPIGPPADNRQEKPRPEPLPQKKGRSASPVAV